MQQIAFWHHHGIMVPPDSFDTELHRDNAEYLHTVYGRTPSRWDLTRFPVGPLAPVPLVVYYYHRYIACAQNAMAITFWNRLVELG